MKRLFMLINSVILCAFNVLAVRADCPGTAWVSVNNNNNVLANAFLGGREGNLNLYHCRLHLDNNIIAGKAIIGNGFRSCWVASNGKEIERYSDFEILTNVGANLQYRPAVSGQSIPSNAISVGRHSNGNIIHVSRGIVDGKQTLGKVDNGNCYLPYQGREVFAQNYELLICSGSDQNGGSGNAGRGFDKQVVGVAFSPYTKEWEGQNIALWNSYSFDDLKKALSLTATKFRSVSTYSMGVNQWNVDKPWDQADANCLVARASSQLNRERNRLDLHVNIGVYQNDNEKMQQKEIDAAFDAANDANRNFRDTVWGIAFTNEYITDEGKGYRVLNMLRRSKARAQQLNLEIGTRIHMCHEILSPSNPLYNVLSQIATQSDFIMCNIYPNEGVVHGSIDNAVASVGDAYHAYAAALKRLNPKIKVIIGETGWPSSGISFNKSPNTVKNLVDFWYSMASWASKNRVLVQMFEAIDEPWKSDRRINDPNAFGGPNGAEGHYGWWKQQGNKFVEKETGAVYDGRQKRNSGNYSAPKLCNSFSQFHVLMGILTTWHSISVRP